MTLRSQPPPPDEGEKLWIRAGAAVGAGLIASAFASLSAAARAPGFLHAWIVLTAIALPPAILLVAVFRAAREGLRALRGDHAIERALGVFAWMLATVAFVARFGAVLRAKTHHHALAGVTLAIGVLVFAIVLGIFVLRAVRYAERSKERGRLVLGALVVLSLVLLVRSIPGSLSPETRAATTDGAAALVGLVLAATDLIDRRILAMVAPPIAVICVVIALVGHDGSPIQVAPLHSALTWGLSALP